MLATCQEKMCPCFFDMVCSVLLWLATWTGIRNHHRAGTHDMGCIALFADGRMYERLNGSLGQATLPSNLDCHFRCFLRLPPRNSGRCYFYSRTLKPKFCRTGTLQPLAAALATTIFYIPAQYSSGATTHPSQLPLDKAPIPTLSPSDASGCPLQNLQ